VTRHPAGINALDDFYGVAAGLCIGVYEQSLTDMKADSGTLIPRPACSKRKVERLMQENLSVGPKMLAEICGGFLTWMGTAIVVMPLVWWATASVRLASIEWRAALVMGIGAPITYVLTGFIERQRSA